MDSPIPPPLIKLDPSLQPPAVSDKIYASLKHRIVTCELLPGQRLMEKELCAEGHLARAPLREALNRLALEGLVSLLPYRGYAVAPITLQVIRDLCEVRRAVESESAALAARRVTSQDIVDLLSVAELRYQLGDRETYRRCLRANCVFHLALVRCSRNRHLETVVVSVLDQLQRPLYLGLDFGLHAQAATAEHLAIVAAVESRNSSRARKVMAEQMRVSEQRILSALERLGPAFVLASAEGGAARKFRHPAIPLGPAQGAQS